MRGLHRLADSWYQRYRRQEQTFVGLRGQAPPPTNPVLWHVSRRPLRSRDRVPPLSDLRCWWGGEHEPHPILNLTLPTASRQTNSRSKRHALRLLGLARADVGDVVGMADGGDRLRAPAGGDELPQPLKERVRPPTRLPVPVLRRCNSLPIRRAGLRPAGPFRRVFQLQLRLTGPMRSPAASRTWWMLPTMRWEPLRQPASMARWRPWLRCLCAFWRTMGPPDRARAASWPVCSGFRKGTSWMTRRRKSREQLPRVHAGDACQTM